eukprot:210314-Rhodomonas_salina.2
MVDQVLMRDRCWRERGRANLALVICLVMQCLFCDLFEDIQHNFLLEDGLQREQSHVSKGKLGFGWGNRDKMRGRQTAHERLERTSSQTNPVAYRTFPIRTVLHASSKSPPKNFLLLPHRTHSVTQRECLAYHPLTKTPSSTELPSFAVGILRTPAKAVMT